MGHDLEEIETRLARCERSLYGDADSREGLSSRMHMTETLVEKIDATLSKLNWLIIAGVLVGVLNLVIGRSPSQPSAPHQSTSVITSDAATAAEHLTSHRTYLTTADVAAKEKVSVREVVDMIAQGEIQPPPEKAGREYRIAAHYSILPQPAEDCGNVQQ
jgi:hypothetical protein